MKSFLVSSIQRYSLHDGHGIRTTVFFAGCPLHCKWCHNPECIFTTPVLLYNEERCTNCGACAQLCPSGASAVNDQHQLQFHHELCSGCGRCVELCPSAAKQLSAKRYSLNTLVDILVRDLPFYEESDGGVTLSGGEVMTQNTEDLVLLLKRLHEHGINVNIDTCGFAPWECFKAVLPWTNTFMYDIKAFDPVLHEQLTGQSNALILSNLKNLSNAGAVIDLRLPIIGGVNEGLEDWSAAADWLQHNIHCSEIHLLPYHSMGKDKYARIGKGTRTFHVPDRNTLSSMQEIFRQHGFGSPIIGG